MFKTAYFVDKEGSIIAQTLFITFFNCKRYKKSPTILKVKVRNDYVYLMECVSKVMIDNEEYNIGTITAKKDGNFYIYKVEIGKNVGVNLGGDMGVGV